jgi:hypothetical protein
MAKTPQNPKQTPAKNYKKVPAQNQSRYNAVTTGAYATGLLPWEDREAYNKHCQHFMKLYKPVGYIERGIVKDMAVNRWQRKRLQLMTTIATFRHEFGQAVVESGAESLQEVEAFVRESDVSNKKVLESIAASMLQMVETSSELVQKAFDADEAAEVFDKLKATCIESCELLKAIDAKLDLEGDFFEHYVPRKFEQRVKLENLLDGQFDKLQSRLQVLQEARLRREALAKAVAVNALLRTPADRQAAEGASPSTGDGSDSDARASDDTGQRSAGEGKRPRDALDDFVDECGD